MSTLKYLGRSSISLNMVSTLPKLSNKHLKISPKFVLPYLYDYSLFIKDPVNPQNNVAKSSFKFDAIKLFFSNAYLILKQYKTSYTNEGENIDNIIYDFLLNKKYN